MLAFAKDITKTDPTHPDESNDPKLRDYMDYQRKLKHELFVYHALDHGKTYLQRNMDELGDDPEKIEAYLEKAMPFSHRFADADTLLLMLRKTINAHNASNNWYRMNPYFCSLVYDCLERFTKIYNRLLNDTPEKAENYSISKGIEIDFDDWIQLYFSDLDFMVGQKCAYTHYTFIKRNKVIEQALKKEMNKKKSKSEALNSIREEFEIDPMSIKVILGEAPGEKGLELFYTSTENPIYEYLYQSEEAGLSEGETLIEHSYFLGYQLKGLSEDEAEKAIQEIKQTQKK